MQKFTYVASRLLLCATIIMLVWALPSCTGSKTAMLCPDLHKHSSTGFAMLKKYRHEIKSFRHSYRTGGETAQKTEAPENTRPAATPIDSLPNKGIASVSDEVPTFASVLDKFKNLDAEQRTEAKTTIATYLAKRPILKKMALKRFDKLDERYPAAEHKADSGGMSAGEILSIVAIVLAFLVPPVGLILGIVSLILINDNGGAGWARALAIASIVIGAVLTLVYGTVIIVVR